jgi:hypothetical protein
MSTKKSFIEENALLDVSDEELAQFSGGSGVLGDLLNTANGILPAAGGVTQLVTKLLGDTNLQTNTSLQTPLGTLGFNTPKKGIPGSLM